MAGGFKDYRHISNDELPLLPWGVSNETEQDREYTHIELTDTRLTVPSKTINVVSAQSLFLF